MSRSLEDIRKDIDALDRELQALINHRAELAQEVAHVKQAAGEDAAGFYRPEREAQILRDVAARNPGPLPGDEVARIFREIMSACLALEMPLRIAFLGPKGTYTHAAALRHFGHSITSLPLPAIASVFHDVESGEAHYGVVPVENSTEGVVTHTLDLFLSSPLRICGEIQLRIHHFLLGSASLMQGDGFTSDQVQRIYSHHQSFAQCREWLDTHLPQAERITVASNAQAAKLAAAETGAVAIAGEMAAEIYGLTTLARNIEDEPDNTTRFLIIGRESPRASGQDKTTVLLSGQNRPGALYDLLKPFAAHGVSMTRIESRPSRKANWEYVFFVDLEGHAEDPGVAKALIEVEQNATLFKLLGAYPRALNPGV
jgi:chorismate mutase/prephenate dehydratase